MSRILAAATLAVAFSATHAVPQQAQQVSFSFNGQELSISRQISVNQAKAARFSVTQDGCSGLCLAPISAGTGVATIGEMEVTKFLVDYTQAGTGLLIDARLPTARSDGFLPTSVNVPHQAVEDGNPYRNQILSALGAREYDGILNFSDAMDLVIFDAGPSDSRALKLIENLLSAGYPPEKLRFYRGGMQVWASLGLNFVEQTQ
ncbi:rhodanese-like domain-containing protein [Algirhabdus cladophorae]|uniref:rhodanese-like domain-containing protein n=1 Tax=Algirhabdus cladophorae TaxID=3377108 RepID=UPI003B845F32